MSTIGHDQSTPAGPGRRALALAVVMAGLVVAAACSEGASVSSETTTTAVAFDPALPAPDAFGSYAVGRRTVELTDADRGRPLVTDIWYPAAAGTTGDASVYRFLPGIEFASDAALADVPVSADGPFPLVVYSHGSGGLRYVASFFTELLASHGFVVVAVDHLGNTAVESVTGTEPDDNVISRNRLLDVQFLIDEMLAATQRPGDALAGAIDAERIGVTGHSYGAFTSLATSGGFTNDLGAVPADDRVDALIAMAPASQLNATDELGAIDVPTLLVSGTADVTTPIDPDTERAWQYVSGRPLWRVDVERAGHQSFTDVCDYQELLPSLNAPQVLVDAVNEYAEEGCTTEYVPIDEAHRLINRSSVAFLLTYVAGEQEYEALLAEEPPGAVVTVKD